MRNVTISIDYDDSLFDQREQDEDDAIEHILAAVKATFKDTLHVVEQLQQNWIVATLFHDAERNLYDSCEHCPLPESPEEDED